MLAAALVSIAAAAPACAPLLAVAVEPAGAPRVVDAGEDEETPSRWASPSQASLDAALARTTRVHVVGPREFASLSCAPEESFLLYAGDALVGWTQRRVEAAWFDRWLRDMPASLAPFRPAVESTAGAATRGSRSRGCPRRCAPRTTSAERLARARAAFGAADPAR